MKHIWQVFKFEYLNCIKNKAFIITTIIIMVLILGMSLVPVIIAGIQESKEPTAVGEKPVIGIINTAYEDNDILQSQFRLFYPDYELAFSDNMENLKAGVDREDYVFGVVLEEPLKFIYVTKNNALMSTETDTLGAAVQSVYRTAVFTKQYHISEEDVVTIMNAPITAETITTGTDQTKNYLSAYILIMIMYMAIVLYGQMVSQSVVTEKNTRAMEMLITCAKPTHLMFGKVIGSGLAGLTQMVLITGVALASVGTISSQSLPVDLTSMFSFSVTHVIYALIFFLTAYFIYSFLLGALSSLASRSEDLNTLTTPVMMVFVISFMIVIMGMTSDAINSPFMVVCSYIPFTAPLVMFARITLADVAFYEIILSIAIQLISIYLLGMLAAAIYRIGVLMYGNPPKFPEIIKLLKEQHKNKKLQKNA